MAAISSTKNRAAQRHDSVHSLPIENHVIARREQAFKAISKTNHFPAELIRCQHYGAQNRIKPRTVATAGQNTNARLHFCSSKIPAFSHLSPCEGERMKVRGSVSAAVLLTPSPSPSPLRRERRPFACTFRSVDASRWGVFELQI